MLDVIEDIDKIKQAKKNALINQFGNLENARHEMLHGLYAVAACSTELLANLRSLLLADGDEELLMAQVMLSEIDKTVAQLLSLCHLGVRCQRMDPIKVERREPPEEWYDANLPICSPNVKFNG